MTSPNPSTPDPTIPKVESSLGKNIFIWGNIALMAGIPWLLILSMAGLAVGDPTFPDWFEIALLGLPAIALVTWLQWIQPISPFSLWFISKPVESLSEEERRALTLIRQQSNGWYVTGWIAIVVAIFMIAVFCKIYAASPLSQVIAPFPDELRFFGVLWAEVFFLLSNVLLQSGVSALRVKLTADSDLSSLTPFAPEKIKNSFTHIGWRSPQFFTNDQAKITIPEPLIEKVNDIVEAQELEISDLVENETIDELLAQKELEVNDVADSFSELVTEGIESEEIESKLVSEESVVDEIESDLLSEEITSVEIASEQLFSVGETQITDFMVEEVIEELDISDYKQEITEETSEVTEDIEIAEISSEATELIDSESSDFENELDELIAFNLYVENILQEYLGEESLDDVTNNPDDTNNDGVVDITELTATSETATAIAEEVLIAEEILEEDIPEAFADLSTLEIPEQETDKNRPLAESQQEPQTPTDPAQSRKYLVEEFLVDKYLAKLEQLNKAEKNAPEETNTNVIQPIETKPLVDEFAELDEIIDGKTIDGKTVTEG